MFINQLFKLNGRKYHKGNIVATALALATLIFVFSASYVLAGSNVTVTRTFNPSADAAITVNAGDDNGFETTPTNAYADGPGGAAVDTNSGSNSNAVATGTGTDKHNFYNYTLTSIPTGSTINGISVRADISVDSLTGSPFTAVRLSWDGGTSWTPEKQTTLTATAETTYTYGDSADTWGRTWSASELTDANFRVQVINGATAANSLRDFSLDWLPVSITFTAPWDSYSDSARTTISDSFVTYGTTVYMKGTGYATGTYNVAYYDANPTGGGQKTATDSGISVAGDGILNSQYLLNTDPNAFSGTWHALVQPTGATAFPTPYDTAVASPDTYALLGNDAFSVQQAAIPEFPTVSAAIVVSGSCFGLYFWMRKRLKFKMQGAN